MSAKKTRNQNKVQPELHAKQNLDLDCLEVKASTRTQQRTSNLARVKAKCVPPLFSAALENKLTARFCHSYYTYKDLLFIQVCSDPAEMHCSTGPTVQCCSGKQAHSRLVPLQIHLWRFALHTGVQ